MTATITEATQREHYVYRLFDAAGSLLYVGITHSLFNRLAQHAYDKDWWADVANITLARYPSRTAAAAAETDAIREETPVKNVQRMTGRTPLRPVRVTDDLWYAAMERAKERGVSLSAVIRKALEDFVNEEDEK